MFGIAGAHRSGKTTLARALAADMGIEFLETKVSDVFANLGLDPKQPMPFDKRLDVQNEILRSLEIQYALREGKEFIADRTPFDVVGYTIADVQRDTLDDAMRVRVMMHLTKAVEIVSRHLAGVLLVQPLPNAPDAEGKAQACYFYMRHVYVLIRDMMDTYRPEPDGRPFIAAETLFQDHNQRLADGYSLFSQLRELYRPEVKLWTPES